MTDQDKLAELTTRLDELIGTNVDLITVVDARNRLIAEQSRDLAAVKERLPTFVAKRNYLQTVTAGAIVIVLLCLGMLGGLIIMTQSRDQSRYNADLMRIVVAYTGCSTTDTPEACSQKQNDRSSEEGRLRIAAVDCLVRRALDGQPPPAPGEPCQP